MKFDLTPEQDSFLASAAEEYNTKLNEMEEKFGVKKLAWGYDQDTLKFSLLDENNEIAYEGDAQIIGTYSKHDGTWEWAWNNPNIEKRPQNIP